MKVIDLLNKIANGEEPPKQIFYKKQWWEYNPYNDYEGTEWGGCLLNNVLINELNDEIIICVEEDKEIEEALDIILLGQCDNWLQKRDVNIKSDFELNPYILEAITDNFKSLYHKQCELVKAVNELKKGK